MVHAASSPVITMPGGGQCVANKIVVLTNPGTPALRVGPVESTPIGVESLDRLCRFHAVIETAPFYPGIARKPALADLVSRLYIFTFADGVDIAAAANDFQNDPAIQAASLLGVPEPFYIPNDPRAGDQWYLAHTQAYQAWDIVRGDTTGHSIIGIVDTGVSWGHPDLAPNIWINAAEDVNGNGIFDNADNDGTDADSNGFIDDVVGWDFADSDNDPTEELDHGTAVAGVASEATDNGLMGAAIGFSARIMCVKGTMEFDPGELYQGVIYAVDNGAQIVNCSWGSLYNYSEVEQEIINAVWQEDVLVIAAAGNDDSTRVYPAAYEHVMAVTSTDANDRKAMFGGYGSWVDISAPGTNIWTTYGQSDFVSYSGTSFSAAMVSGLAALIRAWRPNLTNDQTEALIEAAADTIDHLNPNLRGMLGAGRINCYSWLAMVGNIDPEPLPQDFTLMQNYPNPFNARTTIDYSVAGESDVTFLIYNILGELVERVELGRQIPGRHRLAWDASALSSGVYLYGIRVGERLATKRCVLVK
jgi:subtilisin family serine protease